MKRLFLASLFMDVAGSFAESATEPLAGKSVTFIPTASVPETITFYVKAARKAFEKMGITVDELDVSTASRDEAMRKLRDNEFIYVSGGNVFYLLRELNRTGIGEMIVEQIREGKQYIGESAGSVILAPNIEYANIIDDPSVATGLTDFAGLNTIDFYPVPHFGNIPFTEAGKKIVERYGNALPLRTFGNSEYIEVLGKTVTVTHGKKLDGTTLGKALMSFLTKTSCMTRRIGKPPLT